jgi:hypothetical protein
MSAAQSYREIHVSPECSGCSDPSFTGGGEYIVVQQSRRGKIVALKGNMHFTIQLTQGILQAELSRRETAEETQEFIKAVYAEVRKNGCQRILIRVRHSRPIFDVQEYRQLRRLAASPAMLVALLGDSQEMGASHHYVELLARQDGANIRAFLDEARALDWLRLAPAQSQE